MADVLLNTTTAGNQYEPSVTTLADGRAFVTWYSYDADGNPPQIIGRFVGADGTPQGSDFVISDVSADNQYEPAVTQLSTGQVVVTWQSGTVGSHDIHARAIGVDGEMGAEFVVNQNTDGNQGEPSISATGDGRVLITWSSVGPGGEPTIVARMVDADGVGSDEVVISTTPADEAGPTSVVRLINGQYAVTWQSGEEGDYNIRGQLLNADGTPAGPDFLVNTSTAQDQNNPTVAALADGRFVVTWHSLGANGTDIQGRIFNADGSGSDDFVVNTTVDNFQNDPVVAVMPDGRILVVWLSDEDGAGDFDIRGRFLTADGSGQADDFVINTTTENGQYDPSIAVWPDGRIFVAWTSNEYVDLENISSEVRGVVLEFSESLTITGGDQALYLVPESFTVVADLNAFDPAGNTENGGGLTYTIVPTGGASDDGAFFSIDPNTGLLSFVTPPDFEDATHEPSYVVKVRVTSSDGRTHEQTITVNIGNVNEFTPTITSGNNFTVSENTTGAIVNLNATDGDGETENGGGLTYSVVASTGAQDDGDLFVVDANTGALSFLNPPDFDAGHGPVYIVTVRVTDGAGNFFNHRMTVTVTNDDDAAPVIVGGPAVTYAVPENTTFVHDVNATDADGPAGLTFSIVPAGGGGGADGGLFTIDPTSGVLRFVSAPDYEGAHDPSYLVTVRVTDPTGRWYDQVITVNVTNQNETAPTIVGGPAISYNVDENTTFVRDVQASDADGQTEGNGLTFSIVPAGGGGGVDGVLFVIDPDTGELRFVSAPNFEGAHGSSYSVTVRVTDGGGLSYDQVVTVNVRDVNEAPEIVGGATATYAINENTTAVANINATDPEGETENGGGLTYSIVPSASGGAVDGALFAIDPATGVLGFITAPNFEGPHGNSYSVTVRVTDAGGRFYNQVITVNVANVDDNAPTIVGGPTATRVVDENTTAVTNINANDADGQTEGNGLTYSILSAASGGGADAALFAVNAATGALSFVSAPDFEGAHGNSYTVTVRVTDAGGHTYDQVITVNVANVDDIAPAIVGGPTATYAIDENTTAVANIDATDGDGQTEGNGLTYSILPVGIGGGADGALFAIDPVTGALRFLSAPDFEGAHAPSYTVTVRVADAGGHFYNQVITVNVGNVNEAPMILGGPSATYNVNENTTAVANINASDPEGQTENGGGLTYSIVPAAGGGGADGALFEIDPATGALRFVNAPDFEGSPSSYAVTVRVTDTAGLWYNQVITVNVTNLDDNAPTIVGGLAASFSIDENTTAVANINAADADGQTEGNGLTYSIVPQAGGGGADAALFAIDPATGALRFISAPDFEGAHGNTYEVTVRVTDLGGHSYDQVITVTVADTNDAPAIVGGPTESYTIDENTTEVADIDATDQDGQTEGNGLTYSVLAAASGGAADAALFAIDAVTGALRFINAPDYEGPHAPTYAVTVRVTDTGGRFYDQIVTVNVQNSNEGSAPMIVQRYTIKENTTFVADLEAYDAEGDTEGDGLTYSIVPAGPGGADGALFGVNADTGVLSFVAAPDFEGAHGPNYEVIVRVTDSEGNYTDIAVKVAVTDVVEVNRIVGNSGNNTLTGTIGADWIDGLGGNDKLYGLVGNDTLLGGLGNDYLNGGAGADDMRGGAGNDLYIVDNTNDRVNEAGASGLDTVQASVSYSLSSSIAVGAIERLTLTGAGNINGSGNAFANVVTGNNAKNLLSGMAGNDTLVGNGGDDVLVGGAGSDLLVGGSGRDVFRFDAPLGASNVDRIKDFNPVHDTIQLDNSVMAALGSRTGGLSAGMFHKSTFGLAHDADDRIIYDTNSGELWYDANGRASGGATLIAKLSPFLNITASDFVII